MKKIIPAFIFLFTFNYSFSQDIATLVKLHDISIALGVANNVTLDTLLIKSGKEKLNYRVAEQQLFLLRAADYFKSKDYENANYYIKKVVLRFKNNDYNNLRYVVVLGCYANLKDIKSTAKYLYIANRSKLLAPENMNIIRGEIRNNFKRDAFDKALSSFYYYHARLKILDEIKFVE